MRRRLRPAVLGLLLVLACGEEPTSIRTPEPLDACALVRTQPAARPIAPETLASRRDAALERLGSGVAVITAGWEMGNAVGDPRRQNSAFYWLTGLEHAEAGWLVLVAADDGGHVARLYLPDGPAAPAGVTARSVTGPLDVRCMADAGAELEALLRSDTLAADSMLRLSWSPERDSALVRLLDELVLYDYRLALGMMNDLRAVKDEEEIALLEEAARATAEGVLRGMKAAATGMLEADLQQAIESRFLESGAIRNAFASIVASGPNALELHYRENDEPLDQGELVVVDVGLELGRYAADVARTFPVSGTFSARQRELYDLVLAALQAGIDAARVGGSMAEIDNAISLRLEQSGDLCGTVNCYNFTRHAGGHYVGLDVHDGGSAVNWSRPLEPGVVLNVEPGLYLPEEGIGIRIEETVLITASGPVVLSVGAPLTAEDIEAAMAD